MASEPDRRTLDPETYRSSWRTEVAIRHNELFQRLNAARDPRLSGEKANHVDSADDWLRAAERAVEPERARPRARRRRDPLRLRRLLAWWTGTSVSAAWEAVHNAERELLQAEDDDDVRAIVPRVLTWMRNVMPAGEVRSRYERKLGDYVAERAGQLDPMVVIRAHRDTQIANTDWHANLREMRNQLLVATAALAVALIVLAVWHAINPDFVSLCGGAEKGGIAPRCLTGTAPSGRDIVEVEVIGAVGGLLSVAFGFGAVKTPPSRYNLRAAQAVLKPAAGAATALIGVLLVQSHVVIAPTATPSESLLLAYAAIFGFSQQLLTQFVDRRAGKLLGGESADSSSA